MCNKKVLLAVFFALTPATAGAGTMIGGATMPEQIVQEVTLIQSKVTQAQQLVSDIQRYENMVQNMVTLPQTMYDQVTAPIAQLYGLVQQSEQLGYAGQNIASQFQNINANFNPQITSQYTQQYGTITSGLQSAINSALQTANLNPSNFMTQQQAMQQVQQAMSNPNSRNALLQAAVSVGQATVADDTQLLQTANSEASMNAAWKKNQLARQSMANQETQNAMGVLFGNGTYPQQSGVSSYNGVTGFTHP
ncbi:TrbJ/VirB5 family protein [Acidithiobacillus sp.]